MILEFKDLITSPLNYKHLLKFNDITPFWSPLLSAVKVQNIELCQIVVNKMNKYYEQIQMKWCPCTFAILYASSENLTKSFQFLYQFSKSYEHIKICKGFGFGGYLNPRHESSKVKNLVYAISKVSVLEPLKIILADGVKSSGFICRTMKDAIRNEHYAIISYLLSEKVELIKE